MSQTAELELLIGVTNDSITADSLYFLLKNETVESTTDWLQSQLAPSNRKILLNKLKSLQNDLKSTLKSAEWSNELNLYSFISYILQNFGYPVKIQEGNYNGISEIKIDGIVVDVTDMYSN
jgi:hypothetical protein